MEETNVTPGIPPEPSQSNTPNVDENETLREFYKLLFPSQNIESISEVLKKENERLGDEEFKKELNNPKSFIALVNRMLDVHTDQTMFIRDTFSKLTDTSSIGDSFIYKSQNPEDPNDTDFSLMNRVLKIDKSLNGAEVSGYQARMLILASNKNIKRIPLYNSGFNIVLRGPSLIEINLVYNRLNDDMGDYGRMLGAIFYMYSDFKIKNIIWEFIESLVINSNLNKWDKGNRLRDNVSLLDYQAILLGIGSLMFKNGYEFETVCTNPECKYHITETIDLNLLQLTDFSKLPHEQLRFMASEDTVDPDRIRKYKKALGLTNSIDIDKYRIHRIIPSMTRYLKCGNSFNDELMMSIHDIKDPKIVDQYLKYNYSKIFEPWISHIEILDMGTQEVSFKISDEDSITLVLSEIQNSEHRDTFIDKMNDFIQTSTITNIGYLATPCASCGKDQTNAVNGFIPFDAQNAFFTMLVMRLIQTS